MSRSPLIASLDLGSHKIACFIARRHQDELVILGIGHHPSEGIMRGHITDIKKAEHAIRAAVASAEQMAGVNIDKVTININGNHQMSRRIDAGITPHSDEISSSDLYRLFERACMKAARPERDLIHCFPLHYYVDDTPNIMNPIGLQAKKLKGKLHMIDASASGIFNLAHCLAKCHLDVENYATSSIAASLSSTKEDEKALGTIVFDCGASTTSLAAFEKGVCVYSTSVNIGGQHVTNDLAIGLSTSLEAAERIKILHGHLLPSPRHLQDTIEIPETQPDGRMQMTMATKSQIIDIIRPRIEELFEWLATKMHNDGFYPRGNIVLTGGASQLGGLKEYIAQLHGVPVRMGRPTYLKGMAENTQGTSFSVCAGLLHFSLDQSSEAPIDVRDSHKKAGSPINRLVRWIKEYA